MRIRRRPTVLSRLEEAGRRTPSVAATPLAGGAPGPEGPAGKEGAKGAAGAEGAKGATGAAGPTSGGLILVRAATTAALAANTAPTTTTLEASANGALASQDGIALAVGDRLLVKNEATGSHNGVYEVTSLGAAGSKWKLTRISSMDESSEVVPAMLIAVSEGTLAANTVWQLTTKAVITLGTTALAFARMSATTTITGSVTSAAVVAAGSGFTVEHPSTGTYKVVLTTELPTLGVMELCTTTAAPASLFVFASTPQKKTFEVKFLSVAAAAIDTPFNFTITAAP